MEHCCASIDDEPENPGKAPEAVTLVKPILHGGETNKVERSSNVKSGLKREDKDYLTPPYADEVKLLVVIIDPILR